MSDRDAVIRIMAHFDDLPDPRIDRSKLHSLQSIILLSLIATLGGADNWVQIELFCEANEDWLKEALDLENGIPSHDTFGRVFRMLDADELSKRLSRWLDAIYESPVGEHIAIDGKVLRRTFEKAQSKAALHVLNAWATEGRVALSTVPVEEGENEIVAIPRLLRLLDVMGKLVSIDAIGCQKTIAGAIIDGGGDYLLQVKGNQETLQDETRELFLDAEKAGFPQQEASCEKWYYFEDTDGGHGRVEVRRTWATENLEWFADKPLWPGLRTVVFQRTSRFVAATGKESESLRMFISSRPAEEVERLAKAARAHWTIENQLHWVLDVVFAEDLSRARRDNAPLNLAALRRLALSIIKRDTSKKASLTSKRKMATWSRSYLMRLLAGA